MSYAQILIVLATIFASRCFNRNACMWLAYLTLVCAVVAHAISKFSTVGGA